MASVFKSATVQAVETQPVWLRYKGSILIILAGLGSVLSQLALSADFRDTSTAMGLTIAASLIAMLVNRFTKDGVTPSTAAQLEEAGMRAHLDRPSVTGPAYNAGPPAAEVPAVEAAPTAAASGALPVYDGASTNDAAGYVGEHRAGE